MTVAESLAFVDRFQALAGPLLDRVDVVICPPYTALWPVARALQGSRLQLGAQNAASTDDPARTGQISAGLLADVGCRWLMLGHWEVRRHLGHDDAAVNRVLGLALEAGLRPILLAGEPQKGEGLAALAGQLERVLAGCRAQDVATMAFVYEPERAIGASQPATPEQVAAGCAFVRGWLRQRWGEASAEAVRIIYGGSVAPEFAADLLAIPDLDGLGATRRGRAPETFADIVRRIAQAKSAAPEDGR